MVTFLNAVQMRWSCGPVSHHSSVMDTWSFQIYLLDDASHPVASRRIHDLLELVPAQLVNTICLDQPVHPGLGSGHPARVFVVYHGQKSCVETVDGGPPKACPFSRPRYNHDVVSSTGEYQRGLLLMKEVVIEGP